MNTLAIFGEVLWILALSIMASSSRAAWARMDADVRVPMQFGLNGKPTWRARRNIALAAIPVIAFVIGIMLLLVNRNVVATSDQILIFFGVRATLAAVIAVVHLRWLKAALDVLDAEGVLRPLQ